MSELTRSSIFVSAAQRVTAESVVCKSIAAVIRLVVTLDRRTSAGLRGSWSSERNVGDNRKASAIVRTSRVVATIEAAASRMHVAARHAQTRRTLDLLYRLDVAAKIRTGGLALVIAVLTHSLLLAAFGVPVHIGGWMFRIAVAVLGLAAVSGSHVLAAAWADRFTRTLEDRH
jgi:hypothetical protein